ncbi:MAG: protein-glutamate O-methyltransferase CheR [Epsilonproteobacteria bacterium]|nr:protein-glutamate O-methyltransferase CheR [Campylobacterota bacterium]
MTYLLSKENFAKMAEFIYRKSGIFLEEDKHYEKLAKYIDKRSDFLGLDSFRKYFFKLRFDDKDGTEFQELMNAITVNETYFFREKDQFEVLVNKIMPELHKMMPLSRPLRILSAPCSTGEEPYSIVLHLVEEGRIIEMRDIEVVGIDIDSTVIQKARQGKFTERSVHAIPKDILARWFKKKTLSYDLSEELNGAVDFQVANVFDKNQMRKLGKFDVIFSRNMLIYFDDASRKEVAMTFYDMLNPGGYVLLGHAEYMSRIVSVFKAKKIENTLIYQK